MYNYHKTHHKSSYICKCENRSLLRKGSPEGQKSVLTELDWASPRQSSEMADRSCPCPEPNLPAAYALAGESPRVNPGAGRNSGRTTFGSALVAPCGGGGGGGRGCSGISLPSSSIRTSLASRTSRSSSAVAILSSVSL